MKDNKYENPSEMMERLRNLVVVFIEDMLTIVQGGKLGKPTIEELDACGRWHALRNELANHWVPDVNRIK